MTMTGKVNQILLEASKELHDYLQDILPKFSSAWWQELVFPSLSFQQQRFVEQRRDHSLASLDLAALLRVFDQNWYAIEETEKLTHEVRNYLKEMQTIRNRWAHATAAEFPDEDIYRDLDTIQRFLTVIKADASLIERVQCDKEKLLPSRTEPAAVMVKPSATEAASSSEFSIGQLVVLKSNAAVSGAVVGITPGQPENRYLVFHGGTKATYYASQLQPLDAPDDVLEILPLEQFHARLSALQILHPSTSVLYSLHAARVDFIPYQFRPVLKFIRSDRPRLLIADSVGVGKTIEAGLILREMQARRDIQSVLIICPKPLVTERKWEIEMKRFDERFAALDSDTLRYCIDETDKDGEWPEQYRKAIIPYSLLLDETLHGTRSGGRRRRKGLLNLDPPPRFDLVIVDEAHHIRNVITFAHKAVRFFCDNSEAALFLTATPIQLGSEDLFVLLNVLRPDLVIDRAAFDHMTEPNPHINKAVDLARAQPSGWQQEARDELRKAAATPWGKSLLQDNPEFQRVYDLLGEDSIPADKRVSTISSLEQMHTFSGILNRTRRRDIGEFTTRKPETVVVDFTPDQRSLHDDLLEAQAKILTTLHGDKNVQFMMTTLRRQAASCLYGLAPLLEEILTRRIDQLALEEADETCAVVDASVVSAIEDTILEVITQAQALPPEDPKLEQLRRILRDKQNMPNNKVMVFSSFRHTLKYLFGHLQTDGFRVGLVHGGTPDEERVELRSGFQLPRDDGEALDVLLFSEVGSEGLDYQFCDCIVNYDLPWNPMRIEQRIGRIDRKGQQSESVAIYNLITPGTIDAEIYFRCLVRIGVFHRALGGGEEILGQITREIRDVADNLTLSAEEQAAKLQQVADNHIRLIQEQDSLEEAQLELFGLRLPTEQTRQMIEEASSFWTAPECVENLVRQYLRLACGEDREYLLGEKALKTLRLSQEDRNRLLRDFQQLQRQPSIMCREWEKWLKGSDPHLQVTFDQQCAAEYPQTTFLIPIHPLVGQGAKAFSSDTRFLTAIEIANDSLPAGDYSFAVYEWHFHGVREDLELRVVCQEEAITPHLTQLLQNVVPLHLRPDEIPPRSVFDSLDTEHYKLWSDARREHQDRTRQIVDYRRESLKTSHAARVDFLRDHLNQATDEKIQRMRQSQIMSAEADSARRMMELDEATGKADITAQAVGFGVLRIERKSKDDE